jgi:hypothetical protein
MVNNVYLFGAGISAGTVPMVSETAKEVQAMIGELTSVLPYFAQEANDAGLDAVLTRANSIIDFGNEFLEATTNSKFQITQDEWAKGLLLFDEPKFHRLREFLSIFYTWVQRTRPTCPRILRWAEELIDIQTMRMPSHSAVLTWNYDWQLEAAMNWARSDRNELNPNPIAAGFYRKSDIRIQEKRLDLQEGFRVFKLNGDAFWIHPALAGHSEKTIGHSSPKPSTAEFWAGLIKAVNQLNGTKELSCGISFAFHWTEQTTRLFEAVGASINSAKNLIVAGYSFPQANQELDNFILSSMPNLRNIEIYNLPEHENALKKSVEFLYSNLQNPKPDIRFTPAGMGYSDRIPLSRLNV